MPFSKKDTKKLTELVNLIEENGDCQAYELTYLAVPYLEQIEEIVNAHLASENSYNKETLTDSIAIMRYLAEAYDRLGRFAVSAKYYENAISLTAMLYSVYGDEVKDSSGMVYNALKARNYYVDDDCDDIRKTTLVFLEKSVADDVFTTVMSRRRNLKHDPVEMTDEYLKVIDAVEEKIEANRQTHGFGSCHEIWDLKRKYLAQHGIKWSSPATLNPLIRFD